MTIKQKVMLKLIEKEFPDLTVKQQKEIINELAAVSKTKEQRENIRKKDRTKRSVKIGG